MTIDEMSDEVFTAYLAAFTDGEGYIGLINDNGHTSLTPSIVLANTYLPVMEAIQRRLGYGTITVRRYGDARWKTAYLLRIGNAGHCRAFARLVRPYLQIKHEAADRLLIRVAEMFAVVEAREARNQTIRDAAQRGEKKSEIAERLGVSRQLVSRAIHAHTWPSERSDGAKRAAAGRKRNHIGQFITKLGPPLVLDESEMRSRKPRYK